MGYCQVINTINYQQIIESKDAKIKEERELRKIKISKSTLSSENKFIFSEITNQYSKYYAKNFTVAGVVVDKVKIIYEWDYTLGFGVEIPAGWNWCIKETKSGFLEINSPSPSFLNSNEPNPKPSVVIKKSNATNLKTASQEMLELAQKRIDEDAKHYLSDGHIKKTMTLAFAKHLQRVINASHANSDPVIEVDIKYVEDSTTCK